MLSIAEAYVGFASVLDADNYALALSVERDGYVIGCTVKIKDRYGFRLLLWSPNAGYVDNIKIGWIVST